jgi:hypothetical protein
MKHKVSDLEGALLNAAVAKSEGIPWQLGARLYSQSWADGGPIIERERICLEHEGDSVNPEQVWTAGRDDGRSWSVGPTPLIAAMRAYCGSKFGDEVDLP